MFPNNYTSFGSIVMNKSTHIAFIFNIITPTQLISINDILNNNIYRCKNFSFNIKKRKEQKILNCRISRTHIKSIRKTIKELLIIEIQ
jgi:hypothetical protein